MQVVTVRRYRHRHREPADERHVDDDDMGRHFVPPHIWTDRKLLTALSIQILPSVFGLRTQTNKDLTFVATIITQSLNSSVEDEQANNSKTSMYAYNVAIFGVF